MSGFGQARMSEVIRMLEDCAPGHVLQKKEHRYWVLWNDHRFTGLPLGKHGSRKNVEIRLHHVRDMVRHLEIPHACAKRHFPGL
jgi:hypothetical protein